MSESFATTPSPAESNQGVAALARLTERIATLVPPAPRHISRARNSPAVRAGLARAQAISAAAARRAARPRALDRRPCGRWLCRRLLVHPLCAGGARPAPADGAHLFSRRPDPDRRSAPAARSSTAFIFRSLRRLQVKAETFTAFLTQYAPLPVPPIPAAYLVSYAEFILPIMLVHRLRHALRRAWAVSS